MMEDMESFLCQAEEYIRERYDDRFCVGDPAYEDGMFTAPVEFEHDINPYDVVMYHSGDIEVYAV